MTEPLLTAGMWIHAGLNASVVYSGARPTRNPIWRELRAIPSVLATLAVWVALWWAVTA